MKSLIVLVSYHHNNTRKVAEVLSRVLDAPVRTPQEASLEEVQQYDLVGFGSGIYGSNFHEDMLDFSQKIPQVAKGRVFLFSTSGAPSLFDRYDGSYRERYARECHTPIRERLQSKGYAVVGEFSCAGFNTNSFLKLFGGINRGRPNAKDLMHAEEFAKKLVSGN